MKGAGIGTTILYNNHASNTYIIAATDHIELSEMTLMRYGTCDCLRLNVGASSSVIHDIYIDCDSQADGAGNAIVLNAVSNCRFDDIHIRGDIHSHIIINTVQGEIHFRSRSQNIISACV